MSDGLLVVLALAWAVGSAAAAPGADLSDPTQPLRPSAVRPAGAPGGEVERPTLESVLIGQGRRVAVIDGRRMTEGEERHGVKVHRIRADGVVVSVNGSPPMTLSISNSRMHKELR